MILLAPWVYSDWRMAQGMMKPFQTSF